MCDSFAQLFLTACQPLQFPFWSLSIFSSLLLHLLSPSLQPQTALPSPLSAGLHQDTISLHTCLPPGLWAYQGFHTLECMDSSENQRFLKPQSPSRSLGSCRDQRLAGSRENSIGTARLTATRKQHVDTDTLHAHRHAYTHTRTRR